MPNKIGQDPSKYATAGGVGPRYQGEYEGYVYDPYADRAGASVYYRKDPNAAKKYYQSQGLLPADPKQPSMADSLTPLLVASGALKGMEYAGGKLALGLDALPGLLSGSEAVAPAVADLPITGGLVNTIANPAGLSNTITNPTANGLVPTFGSEAAPAAAAGMGATPLIVPLAVAVQTALSGKTALDMLQGKEKRIDQMGLKDLTDDPANAVGRIGLAIATGGLSEIGNSAFSHKSTKDYQNQRRGDLVALGIEGMNNFDAISKQDAGKVIRDPNFQGESAYDNVSALGNYEAFGNDWDKLNTLQKAQVAKGLGDAGLYVDDKGDRIISGKNFDQARQIKDDILSGKLVVDPGVNPYQNV